MPMVLAPCHAVRTVVDAEDLDALHDDEIDGVVWRRDLPPTFVPRLAGLVRNRVADSRFCLAVEEVRGHVEALLGSWGVSVGPAEQWLAAEVDALARQFARLLEISAVVVRIECVHDDACRKFHRDTLRARLICTYSGPGTEYGAAGSADDPDVVHQVPTGSPILLKGKRWRGSASPTLLHRSPPILGTGLSRLLVVIDEAAPSRLTPDA
ncbi:MAG: DUF1826 domain-containing protein [Pseudomonadota bacterium]